MAYPNERPRTHGEAVLDIRYAIRFNELNERLYNRIDLALSFASLAAGTAAFATVANASPKWAAGAGAVLALLSILGQLVQPARKAERHVVARQRMAELAALAASLDLDEVDARLDRLRVELPTGLTGLSMPAFNDNLRTHGYEADVRPLSRWERLLVALA